MKGYVSIIVPIYKVPEKYLRRCIESLIKQTYEKIEIMLVDDGSPDNCGAICDEYAEKESKIKVIHQENKGLCGARNAGVKQATSEWIMFVDGDDWVESNMCEELIKAVQENVDIICCGMIKDYETKKIYYEYDSVYEDGKVYSTKEELIYMRKMLLNFNGNNACAVAKLIKRQLIQEYNIYHNKELKQGAEALEFNLRLFEKAKAIKFIKKHLYHYIYNDESISMKHSEANHYMVLNCFKKIYETIEGQDQEIIDWFYNRLLYVIITTAISGYFSPANQEDYQTKKTKYEKYLEDEMLQKALSMNKTKGLSKQRKIILWLVKHKCYHMILVLAKIRRMQKESKIEKEKVCK